MSATKPDPSLLSRILTALVLAPLAILGVLYLPPTWFAALIGAVMLLGVWEWTRLIGVERVRFRCAVVLVNAALLLLTWFLLNRAYYVHIVQVGVVWWLLALFWLGRFSFAQKATVTNLEIKMVVGSLLFVPAWCAAVLLREGNAMGPWWLLYVVVLVWVADVGAYFAGRRYGQHKLAPQISPGKTREGVYGALAVSAAYAAICGSQAGMPAPAVVILTGLSLIVVLFSIVGDLFESLIKRHSNHKDSGTLLPGHGGILDRIDSLLAALPIFVVGKLLLNL